MTDRRSGADRRAVPRETPERRGRRPMPYRSLDDLRADTGPPLRVRDLAALTGFSKPKIMADIHGGLLAATRVPCGQLHVWIVAYAEARRYLRALQVLDE